ncbi:MAG: DNA-processing protein DprA [Candidatus Gastranaerophilales bacterium]|nr:DNA-processing protein DprA [Candidatus Gastranaerophilales bacterium]
MIIKSYTKNRLFGKILKKLINLVDTHRKVKMSDEKENTIMVPLDGVDKDDIPDTADALAHELATIQQSSKKIAIIGSRNLPITHQQIIETISWALANNGNTIITSGGSSGTNAAAIRGAMRANPQNLLVILPQTIGQQPSDVQDQLIGVPNITEHPDRAMMTLADASRICNREIIDECQQLICFLSHTSGTLHKAVAYAEETYKIVTTFYLD